MCPSTRQNAGVAGLIRPAGVGPLSATDNGVASTIAAVSIDIAPARTLASAVQPAAGSLPSERSAASAGIGSEAAIPTHDIAIAAAICRGNCPGRLILLLPKLLFFGRPPLHRRSLEFATDCRKRHR